MNAFLQSSLQAEFFALAVKAGALLFGTYTTKAGRESPYFFNAGNFSMGAANSQLCRLYATTILASGLGQTALYGPAYKGIPLAAGVAAKLFELGGIDLPFVYNRKEPKDHGEGGDLVGPPLAGEKVLIIDDVISAGTSVRESYNLITAAGATPVGVIVALDRQERGSGPLSAVQEVQQTYGIPVIAIATLENLVQYLGDKPEYAKYLPRVEAYRARYGVT